jgi:heme O synthase-like polyprenyltransferase
MGSEEIVSQAVNTHDTFVIGGKEGKITFIKGYIYSQQKEEAQSDLTFVQKEFDFWYISHVGNWSLSHKYDETFHAINVPL